MILRQAVTVKVLEEVAQRRNVLLARRRGNETRGHAFERGPGPVRINSADLRARYRTGNKCDEAQRNAQSQPRQEEEKEGAAEPDW